MPIHIKQRTDERGLSRSSRATAARLARITVGAIAPATFYLTAATPVFAAQKSEELRTSAADAAIGTLPLLAAFGVGIAVAVFAVVAFLQMTARGRSDGLYPAYAEGAGSSSDDVSYMEWNDSSATSGVSSNKMEEDTDSVPLEDFEQTAFYTLPLPRVHTPRLTKRLRTRSLAYADSKENSPAPASD
ncbi:hypothetical protein [Cohnella faecalis]|uniref:Uncharacterized protein n=1 Tax=Cohnella faecalis TaxID=2315694 RepID=A0A398CIL8_9BACL|nr:hypothetical protein [Cohnella faecalis]RIE02225.1 hypothetical protein D3H35_15935 [Cohnella faecalis]